MYILIIYSYKKALKKPSITKVFSSNIVIVYCLQDCHIICNTSVDDKFDAFRNKEDTCGVKPVMMASV